MRLIFAPDSFKGSLSSGEMCRILQQEARAVFPDAELLAVPMADGGEGTVDALYTACGGYCGKLTVTGPEGTPVQAAYAVLPGGDAVMELAQCAGLPLMHSPDPMRATTLGAGEMLRHMMDAGAETVYIGLGGSATNDGGMGLLTALGARFYDAAGQLLSGGAADMCRVARADFSGMMDIPAKLRIIADVTNPLLGEHGATYVYGPQKGAAGETLHALEAGMARYADLVEAALGVSLRNRPGAGAAGGTGFALLALGAEMLPGTEAMLRLTGLAEKIPGASLVVTGEGRLDAQSVRYGKVCGVIARLCADAGVPCCAIVGSMGEGAEAFLDLGNNSIMTLPDRPMTLEESMRDAERLYRSAARRMFRLAGALAGALPLHPGRGSAPTP